MGSATPLNVIIITGYSGSGKSTAAAAFADCGYYCVDNMPVALLPKFLELPIQKDWESAGLVFVMDLREKDFLASYQDVFDTLRNQNIFFKILFFEAEDRVLVQRYSQTRRHHPLKTGSSLIENIRDEKKRLETLRGQADKIIDTSRYTVHELTAVVKNIAAGTDFLIPMRIELLSFGFKFGIPVQMDLLMDVRFLANPYFVPELKEKNGLDPSVKNYVLSKKECQIFLLKYFDLLDFLIPLYEKEGKAYLTIAVGCTGGRHRSVAVTEAISDHLKAIGYQAVKRHRDMDKSPPAA